jgi:hypothetical protein
MVHERTPPAEEVAVVLSRGATLHGQRLERTVDIEVAGQHDAHGADGGTNAGGRKQETGAKITAGAL